MKRIGHDRQTISVDPADKLNDRKYDIDKKGCLYVPCGVVMIMIVAVSQFIRVI